MFYSVLRVGTREVSRRRSWGGGGNSTSRRRRYNITVTRVVRCSTRCELHYNDTPICTHALTYSMYNYKSIVNMIL